MKIDQAKMVELLTKTIDHMRDDIKRELMDEVKGAIESHRRAVWVREKWCCEDMVTLAKFAWQLPNPPNPNDFGQTRLQLRGGYVNYCPFCGVKV